VSDLPLDQVMPYIGLIPYAEQDAPFFFGRERERAMITANLMASRLTVLYGPSGAGKSSVLRAGVEHTLREQAQRNLEEHGEPELAVVVFNNWRDDPIAGLSLAVHETAKQTLTTMNQEDDSSPVPQQFVENLEAWTKRLNGELLIILDQFEEYFLYHAQEDGEHTFAVEFSRAVNSVGLRANFLVSLREDALSKLDRFKGRIPNLFDNYLRIGHLTKDAARDAIEQPLQEYNRRQTNEVDHVTIEPALVEAVLSQVQTGRVTLAREGSGGVADSNQQAEATIETSYLQLVMTRLWNEEKRAGSHMLRLATLEQLKGAEHIVRTHLDSVMDHLSSDESEIAAEVFRYLVTPSGSKIAYTKNDLVAYTAAPDAQLAPVLEKLSGSGLRILRTVVPPPDQPRETRYEIFHDVLAAAILDWRGRYVQEKEKRELTERLAEGARVEQQRAEEARQRKELEAEARASRRLRRLALALVLVSLIAVVAAALAVIGWTQTESARAQLSGIVEGLQRSALSSGDQAAVTQATADAAAARAAALQATANAGVHADPTVAVAQANAAKQAATQGAVAQVTAQAAAAQAKAQAAAFAQAAAYILDVPYKGQNDSDASLKRSDSGQAALAMILMANGRKVTTNDVTAASGILEDATLEPSQIVKAARAFGLETVWRDNYTLDDLKRFIAGGQPPIALIKYANLPDRVDKGKAGAHYVVVVGYDDATNRVFINDPDYFPGTSGGFQKAYDYQTWLAAWGGFDRRENLNFVLITPRQSLRGLQVPWNKSLTGVGMGNPQPFTQEELRAIADSQVEAVKILSLADPEENKKLVADLQKIRPDMFIVARLFFPVDVNSKTRFSPQDFVNFVDNGMKALYESGVRYFEIHNEPNLEIEGMNWNWANGEEFGRWFQEVSSILRSRYPEAKLGFPGLSPQPNVDSFLEEVAAAANSADWIGVHAYWQQPPNQPPYPMNGDNAGFYWRAKFKPRFPNKMLMITEFSNNSAAVSPEDKGKQYAQYYQMLRNEPNIGAAFSAFLGWPGQDHNHESWVGSAIPATVGGLIGQPSYLDAETQP
jgi:hypothetical protein